MDLELFLKCFSKEENSKFIDALRGLTYENTLACINYIQTNPKEITERIFKHNHKPYIFDGTELIKKILSEVDIKVNKKLTGKVIIGKNRAEKIITLYFTKGKSTGIRHIYHPHPYKKQQKKQKLNNDVKLLLVNLKSPKYPVITVPLAIITLGGYLINSFGRKVRIDYIDLQLDHPNKVINFILAQSPDILGISARVGSTDEIFTLLNKIKVEINKEKLPIIVLGNVIPTYAASEIHHKHPDSLIVIGRGENSLKAIVTQIGGQGKKLNLQNIPNLSFLSGLTINEIGGEVFNLNALTTPDWKHFFANYDISLYQEIWMEASRGCPHKKSEVGCAFCAIMPNNGSRDWAPRSQDAVIDEIKLLTSLGVNHIRFADEEFMGGNILRSLQFAQRLIKCKRDLENIGLKMPTFDFSIRVDDVHKRGAHEDKKEILTDNSTELSRNSIRILALQHYKQSGLVQVYLGIESGSRNQLKRLYKAVTPEDNSKSIQILRDLKIQVAAGWIMFDPMMDNLNDLKDNLSFLHNNKLIPSTPYDDFITRPLNRMRVLEGSPIVDILAKEGLLREKKGNLFEYDFQYKDIRVQKITDLIDKWEDIIAPFLYALKNKVGLWVLGGPLNEELSLLSKYLFNLKMQDLIFLNNILERFEENAPGIPKENDLSNLLMMHERNRDIILHKFTQDLINGKITDQNGTLTYSLEQTRYKL